MVISCHAAKNRHVLQFSLLLPLFIHRVGTIFAYSGKEKSHAQAVHDSGRRKTLVFRRADVRRAKRSGRRIPETAHK